MRNFFSVVVILLTVCFAAACVHTYRPEIMLNNVNKEDVKKQVIQDFVNAGVFHAKTEGDALSFDGYEQNGMLGLRLVFHVTQVGKNVRIVVECRAIVDQGAQEKTFDISDHPRCKEYEETLQDIKRRHYQ